MSFLPSISIKRIYSAYYGSPTTRGYTVQFGRLSVNLSFTVKQKPFTLYDLNRPLNLKPWFIKLKGHVRLHTCWLVGHDFKVHLGPWAPWKCRWCNREQSYSD